MSPDAFKARSPAGEFKRGRWAGVLIPALACIAAASLVVSTYHDLSPSFDEGYHIAAGVAILQSGDYVPGFEQPPLARWPIGLLPYLSGARYRPDDGTISGVSTPGYPLSPILFDGQTDPMRRVIQGRLGVLLFLPVLLVTLWVWASRLHGPAAGVAALVLGAFSPNLMAHAGIASTDFPVTAMLFLACYRIYRWAEEPTVINGCLGALTVSLAAMTKYSALVFLPPIALLLWAGMWRKRSVKRAAGAFRWSGPLKRGALYLAVAFAVAWACYGFSARPISDPSRQPRAIIDRFATTGSLLTRGIDWFERNVPVPFLDTVNGLRTLNRHNRGGHEAFLLGEVRKQGWWYYFPAVIVFKTTLPLLALMLLAVALTAVQRSAPAGRIYSLGAIVAILGVSMTGSINIGVRHILPAYPFMAMLAASAFHGIHVSTVFQSWLPRLAAALVIWHTGEGVLGMPDNISYFNQTVRGREHRILGDSNLDWGQGLVELRRFVKANGIESFYFHYFGSVDPRNFGIPEAIPMKPDDQPRGWAACSVTYLQGIYGPGCRWAEGREPVSRIGRTIWMYRIP